MAFPFHDLDAVERNLRSTEDGASTARSLRQGRALVESATDAVKSIPRALNAARRVGDVALAPAKTVGPPILKGLGGLASLATKSPRATVLGLSALGAGVSALETSAPYRHGLEQTLMDARGNPDMVIHASLNEFLDKKASLEKVASGFLAQNIVQGMGKGIGAGLAGLVAYGAGSAYGKLRDSAVMDGRRRRMVEDLFQSDTIIHDAIQRNPKGREMLLEAYGTMVRFAPTLSMDKNAVKSFLREAAIGGAGVNYATIKNLVETENEINKGDSFGKSPFGK